MELTSKVDELKSKLPNNESEIIASADTDDIDEIDNDSQSILMGIISQLRLGSDLTKITLPTFILEKKSMLERITNFFQIPEILILANSMDNGRKRFLEVLKWYLASWHIAPKAMKKPLNPILGEVFNCYWDDLPCESTAFYLAEQTSHHPPKSSYFYLNPELKIRVDGTIIPNSKFLGNSSAAIMKGLGHVHLHNHAETYVMNQPNIYCRGILFGKLRYELGDQMIVKCEKLNLEAIIEFKVKGLISGSYDAIKGKVIDSSTGDILYNIFGKWNDTMFIKDTQGGAQEVFFDTKTAVIRPPKVRPFSEQLEYESRRLWKPTIDALGRRDHDLATIEKAKVENQQRLDAQKRLEDGVDLHPRLFKEVKGSDCSVHGLEFVMYKHLDLRDDPAKLKSQLFEVIPFLPGQKFNDQFHIPAFNK
ncbi:Oxysterol-binding protein [Metschnikowia bicuspidata]|uniref:Oxysterol-binding protein n=1 Tax=Metschnikowia bicuspidata TaxID=27322 RepID=A0A4P9Z8N3_9ASCO|nr:Oxysterol-binding protein [Metschnikowia bicuspidata]